MLERLAIGLASALLLAAIGAAFRHRQYLILALRCVVLSRNKKLRVSMAAILSVSHDERYILVRNRHRPETFGPIGGVYKYYAGAREQLDRCGYIPQVRDEDMKYDLRGFIKGKDFPSFMRWFLSGKNREIEPITRELIEELGEVGLTKESETIHAVQFELVKTIYEMIDVVQGADYAQFRYFAVYQLCPDEPKSEMVKDILCRGSENNPKIIAVTAKEIMLRRATSGEEIATHTEYLIHDKRIGPEPPPFMEARG